MTGEPQDPIRRTPFSFSLAVPGTIALLAVAIMVGGLYAILALRYDRSEILAGEIWRLLTGHLVHLNWNHLLMNLGGLLLIWLLFGSRLNLVQWIIVIVAGMLGISVGLLLLHPSLGWYVGLSGLLHSMFVAGAFGGLFTGYRAEWLLLSLITIKLAWEQVVGSLPGSEEFAGGTVVVHAHLYGAVTGLVIVLLLRRFLPHPSWKPLS